MAEMTTEEYIAHYGAALSEADKRYFRAFGVPAAPRMGAGHNPSTPGFRVVDAPSEHAYERDAHRARMDRLDREADSY